MNEIERRLKTAKIDSAETERLLSDYLPFIKKQISDLRHLSLEYDDMLSLAMLTFVGCIKQYTENRGSFLSFCSVCIRNRLIDESRRQKAYADNVIPLYPENTENSHAVPELSASLDSYSKEQERLVLCEEIDRLNTSLNSFGIRFQELPKICPKQDRSRRQCLALATEIIHSENYKTTLFNQKKLSQQELAKNLGISAKTVEKHRKYIITLVILLLGDYPGIRSFLPQYREVNP